MADSEPDVDNIIEQLLSVRGSRPGRQVNLTEGEIRWLCVKSKEIFTNQPVLLELEAPIKICGKLLFWRGCCQYNIVFLLFISLIPLQVIFMVNIMTFSDCLSMVDSPQLRTICFWGMITLLVSLASVFTLFFVRVLQRLR